MEFVSAAHSPLTHSECPHWRMDGLYMVWMFFSWYFLPHLKKKNELFGTCSTGVHSVSKHRSKLQSNRCLWWQGFLVCTISIALYYSENKISIKSSHSPCGHAGMTRWVGTIVQFSYTLLPSKLLGINASLRQIEAAHLSKTALG